MVGHHLLLVRIGPTVFDTLVSTASSPFKLVLQALLVCLLVALAVLVGELLTVLSHELLLVLDLFEGHFTRG